MEPSTPPSAADVAADESPSFVKRARGARARRLSALLQRMHSVAMLVASTLVVLVFPFHLAFIGPSTVYMDMY